VDAIEPDDDVGITIGESAGVYSDHDVPSEWWEIDLSNGDGCMQWVIGSGAQRGAEKCHEFYLSSLGLGGRDSSLVVASR